MEMVEVINKERVPVGRIVERDTQLNNGEYHLIVHAWIKDYKSNYLISRRAENKSFGGMWECTGGGVIFGETSIEAAVRETKEEVGLLLKPENGRFLTSYFFEDIHAICDVWLFHQEVELNNLVLQENETSSVKLVSLDVLIDMFNNGEFLSFYDFAKLLRLTDF